MTIAIKKRIALAILFFMAKMLLYACHSERSEESLVHVF